MTKRILHVINSMNLGGAETQIIKYYKSIDRNTIQFDFLILTNSIGYYEDEIEKMGGEIYKIPYYNKFNPINRIKYIYSIARRYQVVHAHCSFFNGIIMLLAYFGKVDIRISHIHTSSDDKQGLFRNIYINLTKFLINKTATHKIACSENASLFLYNNIEIILKNALKVEDYRKGRLNKTLKESLNISNKDIVFGHIGRFCEVKNHYFLIDLFYKIYNENNNSKLILVGDGGLKSDIEQYVGKLELANKVIFLGLRNDIPELLNIFDILLFPSLYEGLPLTLVEAQAAGVPIIASDTITSEVDMGLELIRFEELKVDRWMDLINQSIKDKKDTKYNELIKEAFDFCGYSIDEQVYFLENLYSTR